jgi:hypothetical protein
MSGAMAKRRQQAVKKKAKAMKAIEEALETPDDKPKKVAKKKSEK